VTVLFGGWVSSFLAMDWMIARDQVGKPSLGIDQAAHIQRLFHQPLFKYESTELPGAHALTFARMWCYKHGFGYDTSLDSIKKATAESREQFKKDAIKRTSQSR